MTRRMEQDKRRRHELNAMEFQALFNQRDHLSALYEEATKATDPSPPPHCPRCSLWLLPGSTRNIAKCNPRIDEVTREMYADSEGQLERFVYDRWCNGNFIRQDGSLKSLRALYTIDNV